MADSPASTDNSSSLRSGFISTPRIRKYLTILNGAKVTLEEIAKVSKGIIDFIGGKITSQNLSIDKTNKVLQQVTIVTENSEYFTFTVNEDVAFQKSIFELLHDADLIPRGKTIYVSNLNDFAEYFKDAKKSNETIIIVYDRMLDEIKFIQERTQYNHCLGSCDGDGICQNPSCFCEGGNCQNPARD